MWAGGRAHENSVQHGIKRYAVNLLGLSGSTATRRCRYLHIHASITLFYPFMRPIDSTSSGGTHGTEAVNYQDQCPP